MDLSVSRKYVYHITNVMENEIYMYLLCIYIYIYDIYIYIYINIIYDIVHFKTQFSRPFIKK